MEPRPGGDPAGGINGLGEKTLEIIQLNESHRDAVAPLIAGFRSTLLSYKGIQSEPDTKIHVGQ